eukprot:Blabericola_migrator_1__5597@NODE_284_length_10386_cov_93_763155_g234_i0_p2_GENE_NODE_284_length_10386_cov_93_763155_g234_i0NODE_284_length_10386_cov_93_763155_g234_i0_p2_ORF_typecomplete_len1001_score251_50TH1/PF04858_13/1_7e18TH1/PF04858_13/1e06_NODE_284_length_10386_cov_93_763155_g234_i069009902
MSLIGDNDESPPPLLASVDAMLDPAISQYVEVFISNELKKRGITDEENYSEDLLYELELSAVNQLIEGYQGLPRLCESVGRWSSELDKLLEEMSESRGIVTSPFSQVAPELDARKALFSDQESESTEKRNSAYYIMEGLCMVLHQEFKPGPFKKLMAATEGAWAPPEFYWTLLKNPQVVEAFRRLYGRHRGSEFLGAFLQDYCERHERLDDGFRVSSRGQLTEITAHFSIFTKAFGELLVEFLVEEDTYEFGDNDPHNISRLLCHAENAYCYAQALLHFLPYCQSEFASCRRLAQLIYRNLRETRAEYAAADRLLLCTSLPSYPDLFELFKQIRETDEDGRIKITGPLISMISDSIARICRRFEKHKTLLAFYSEDDCPSKAADFFQEDWEKEILPESISDFPELEMDMTDRNDTTDSGEEQPETIQPVDWPVTAEIRIKSTLPVVWTYPSASQAGDLDCIIEEEEEENDRRGFSKLILPPMNAIRETMLLDTLWDILMIPRLAASVPDLPVGKLIELVLMLTTLTNYELVVLHLQAVEDSRQQLDEEEDELSDDVMNEDEFYVEATHQAHRCVELSPSDHTPSVFDEDDIQAVMEDALEEASVDEQDKGDPHTHNSNTPESHTHTGGLTTPLRSVRHSIAQKKARATLSLQDSGSSKKPRLAMSEVSSYIDKSRVPSILESHVLKNPHEGFKLKAFRPEDPMQAMRLNDMFSCCSGMIETYKRKARKELFELYHLTRSLKSPYEALGDHFVFQLCLRCTTSAGASATLHYLKDIFLVELEGSDPLYSITPAMLTLLMRICIWHPRKRVLVISLFKKLLERSFNGPETATEETQGLRRKLISVALSQIGLAETPLQAPSESLPWKAVEVDWQSAVTPGYKLLFHMIRELLHCFDLTLLRETMEFILVVCGAPYSVQFAEKLCDLLQAIVYQNCFDFDLPINKQLKGYVQAFLDNLYGAWAPATPPDKILQQCRIISNAIESPSRSDEDEEDEGSSTSQGA